MALDPLICEMDAMIHRDTSTDAVDSVKQGLKVSLGHFIFG
jgi:hypothetical protein